MLRKTTFMLAMASVAGFTAAAAADTPKDPDKNESPDVEDNDAGEVTGDTDKTAAPSESEDLPKPQSDQDPHAKVAEPALPPAGSSSRPASAASSATVALACSSSVARPA